MITALTVKPVPITEETFGARTADPVTDFSTEHWVHVTLTAFGKPYREEIQNENTF